MQNTPHPTVTNTITSSQVAGPVIQAGTITGLHISSAEPADPVLADYIDDQANTTEQDPHRLSYDVITDLS